MFFRELCLHALPTEKYFAMKIKFVNSRNVRLCASLSLAARVSRVVRRPASAVSGGIVSALER